MCMPIHVYPGTSLSFEMIARSNVATGVNYDISWSITDINPVSFSSLGLWLSPSTISYEAIGSGSVFMDLPATGTFLPSITQMVTVRLSVAPPVAITITPSNGFGSLPTGKSL